MFKPTEDYEVIDKYKNYLYAVWFHDIQGYRCGYVHIPENHPFYEVSFTELNFNAVGLTFSGHIKGLNGWFIGWDHHHLWDGIDEDSIRKLHRNDPNIEDILEYARAMSGDSEYYNIYATTEDVEAECHRVIEELIQIGERKDETMDKEN